MVELLNHMSARISLLELLMHSTVHRKLLMKIPSGANVEQNILRINLKGLLTILALMISLLFRMMRYPLKEEDTIRLFMYLLNVSTML